MPYDFQITSGVLPSGRTVYYAKLTNSTQQKFVVGYSTMYQGNTGLYNTKVTGAPPQYVPSLFENQFDFWAYFIFPTATAESKGLYHCLNTYDRAKFTFSFMQYAAHVPNGDFVKFFKKLLQTPEGQNYFPKLTMQNNRIHYRNSNGTLSQLESDISTEALMNYLNPSLSEVEQQELISSARFVHWASNDELHRKIQVETAIEHFKLNMVEYNRRFNLNNVPAKVCAFICDIRHQGRGTNDRIANAFKTNGAWERAYSNSQTIGHAKDAERIKTVKNTITALQANGTFNKKYQSATNVFN